ncbi:MAG: hypothetical protein RIG84_03530 [Roseovarius sp.]
MGTNRYAYANNDPINKFDPNGNFFGAFLASFVLSAASIELPVAITTALNVLNAVQTVNALAQGADPGDVARDFVVNSIATFAGAQLGGVFAASVPNTEALSTRNSVYNSPYSTRMGRQEIDSNFRRQMEMGAGRRANDPTEGVGGLYFKHQRSVEAGAVAGAAATTKVIHGNSLNSPKQTDLYMLLEAPGVSPSVAKYGITSFGQPGRYTAKFLASENVSYFRIATFPNRIQARLYEYANNVAFVARHGRLPRLSKVY